MIKMVLVIKDVTVKDYYSGETTEVPMGHKGQLMQWGVGCARVEFGDSSVWINDEDYSLIH